MSHHPQRRADDPRSSVEADALEKWWANLPAHLRWQRRVIGILFIAFAALFTYGGHRDDEQRSALEESQRDDRVRAEKICDDLTDNARRFNALVDTLIHRTKQADIPAEQKVEAVRLYTSAKQTLPVCRPPAEETP